MVTKKEQISMDYNAKQICNANRDTLDQPAYQEPTVRNKAVIFGGC